MPAAAATARASPGNAPGENITEINTHRIEQCFTTAECSRCTAPEALQLWCSRGFCPFFFTRLGGVSQFKTPDFLNTKVSHPAPLRVPVATGGVQRVVSWRLYYDLESVSRTLIGGTVFDNPPCIHTRKQQVACVSCNHEATAAVVT